MKTLGNTIANSFSSITLTNGISFVTITAPPTGIYIISLPPNLGSPGQFLQTDGAGQTSWQTLLPGTGTVTSVNATTPSFLDVTITNPTSNANLAFTLSGTALPTLNGGTGLTTVGTAGQVLTSNGTTLSWVTPYITSVNAAELTVALGTLSLSTALATTISDAFATANTALATAGAAGTAAAAAQTTADSAFALATTANALAVAAGADITTLGNKTISLSPPSFLSVTGSPITLNTGGTLTLGYSGTALPVANGGTG